MRGNSLVIQWLGLLFHFKGQGFKYFTSHIMQQRKEKGRKKKRKLSPVSRPNLFFLLHPKGMDGYVKIYF